MDPKQPALDGHRADHHAVLAGIVTAFVGFTSSFAVVLAGLRAVGADQRHASSGLLALCVAMGATGILLGLTTKIPISVAWSTPGAALLVSSTHAHYGYPTAVGAFLVGGALAVLCGLWRPFGRLVASIPVSVGSAMLAGVLLSLCVAPVEAIAKLPSVALPVVATWVVVDQLARRWAVPAALVAAGIAIALTEPVGAALSSGGPPDLIWTTPHFDVGALVGLAVPLFIVTMAAQNIPGMAVLATYGYRPSMRKSLIATGSATVLGGGFGALAINLAAITAALAAGPSAHPDPDRRWIASVTAGATYIVLGLGAGFVTAFAALSPPLLLETVAGLALLRTLGGSLSTSLEVPAQRDAAVITFVVTASGITIWGVGAPFWGIAAGLSISVFRAKFGGRALKR